MKSSTLSAHDELAQALQSIKAAQRAIAIARELSEPTWLHMEVKHRLQAAERAVEDAAWGTAELLRSEDGDT